MKQVSNDEGGKQFADGVEEANRSVGLGYIVGWFAWFMENKGGRE